jgi:hypothetical protein
MGYKNSSKQYDKESIYDRKRLGRKERKMSSRTNGYVVFSLISHNYYL